MKQKVQKKKKKATPWSRFRAAWSGERPPHGIDYASLFLVLFLLGFGLVILYSTSSYRASLVYGDTAYWVKRQGIFAFLGVIAMLLIAHGDYRFFKCRPWMIYVFYWGTIALLLLTRLVGTEVNGSKRWLYIGPIGFQPSEVAKITLIFFLATYASSHQRQMEEVRGLVKPALFAGVFFVLVALENLSTGLVILAIAVVMLFVATPLKKIFGLAAIAVLLLGGIFVAIEPYRLDRIRNQFTIFLNPSAAEAGNQTLQGLYAIGSGGLFGKGLGQSVQKLGSLQEARNDMIFSVICEELGLFGALCVLALFFALLWRFMRMALRARDLYGSLIMTGIFMHIATQTILNVGVSTNLIPNTGMTLPFISYGGSSIFIMLAEMGLMLSISKYTKQSG